MKKRFRRRHALVLAKRNLIKLTRTPEQLIDVTLQPIIFLALFLYVFGGAIAHGSHHDYLQFLLPGLIGQTIAMSSISIGQNMNADIAKGVFDRFRSLPIARSVPLVGAVLADFFRYLLLCVILLGFGYALGFRITTNPLLLLAALGISICFALAFAWVSLWVGMTVRTAGAVQGVMFLLIFPLSFGSNVFVQASTMPGWLQAFVNVNPLSHLVSAVRGLLLGGPVATQIGWTFALDRRAACGVLPAGAARVHPPDLAEPGRVQALDRLGPAERLSLQHGSARTGPPREPRAAAAPASPPSHRSGRRSRARRRWPRAVRRPARAGRARGRARPPCPTPASNGMSWRRPPRGTSGRPARGRRQVLVGDGDSRTRGRHDGLQVLAHRVGGTESRQVPLRDRVQRARRVDVTPRDLEVRPPRGGDAPVDRASRRIPRAPGRPRTARRALARSPRRAAISASLS